MDFTFRFESLLQRELTLKIIKYSLNVFILLTLLSCSEDTNEVKKPRATRRGSSSVRSSSKNQNSRYTVGTNKKKPRDNSSRFDD